VDGRFWYPLLPIVLLRVFIPQRILLLARSFWLKDGWPDFEELQTPISQLVVSTDVENWRAVQPVGSL
jgi:hypothetical protein